MTDLRENGVPLRSYREKVALIHLLTTLGLYLPYFAFAWRALPSLDGTGFGSSVLALHLLLIPVVVLQVLLVPLGLAAFWLTGQRAAQEPADERDQAIEARAVRAAYITVVGLGFGAVYVALPLSLSGALPAGLAGSPAALLLGGLTAFVLAEAVRFGVQLHGYRRGY